MVPTTRPGYNLIVKSTDVIPIQWPPLVVSFASRLDGTQVETLKNLEASVIPAKKEQDQLYSWSGDAVTSELLSFLYKHKSKPKLLNVTPFGSINLGGYRSLFKVLGIITAFLRTQAYPAFVGPVLDHEDAGGMYDTIEGFITAKRKGTFGERDNKRARLDEGADEDDDMEEEDVSDDITGLEDYRFGDATSHIPKAKPSTAPESLFGSPTTMPTLPGLCFPYFPNMIETDMNFVSSIVRTYFLECLGDTREAILGGYKTLKGAMGALASTPTGNVLQHIFCGIKLAIEAQARLYLFIDGRRYTGFSLHGWYFSVSLDGYKHTPIPYDQLLPKVRLIDEHAVAVAQIMERLSKLRIGGKKVAKNRILEARSAIATSPRQLADFIRTFDELEDAEAQEIEKLANKLSFPQRYLEFSVENILYAVDLLAGKSFPPDDKPMFYRGGTLTTRNPALSIFAMFGQEGFSFRTVGGKAQTVPASTDADTLFRPYVGKGNKEVKPTPTMIISKRSLGLCVDDWRVFLVDHVFLNKQTRDSAFRCITFGGGKAKDFWYGLINRVGVLEIDKAQVVHADEIELGDEAVEETEDDFLVFL